jgi:hypothetical protein
MINSGMHYARRLQSWNELFLINFKNIYICLENGLWVIFGADYATFGAHYVLLNVQNQLQSFFAPK